MINRDYIEKLDMFRLLTKRSKGIINASCLLGMSEWFEKQTSGRLSEKTLLDCLERFCLSLPSDDEEISSSRDKARQMLNTFINCGYLEEEYRNQERHFLLSVYAYQIIDLIKRMDINEEMEYSSNLLTLHGMFSDGFSKQLEQNPYTVVLKQSKQMTKEIEDHLRILQASIKNRVIDTSQEMTLQDIYMMIHQAHNAKGPFDKFLRLDKEFNAKRMEAYIPSKLNELQSSEAFIESAVAQCMETEGKNEEEAKKEIIRIISYLKNEYSKELPNRIRTIQSTIREYYTKAALKAEIATSTVQNTVNEQLKYIYAHMDKIDDSLCYPFFSLSEVELYDPLQYISRKSTPKNKRTVVNETVNEKEIELLLKKEEERQNKEGFEELNKTMYNLLSAKECITDKDFVIQSDEDLLFINNAIIYSTNENRCYDITFFEERTSSDYGTYNCFRIDRRLK